MLPGIKNGCSGPNWWSSRKSIGFQWTILDLKDLCWGILLWFLCVKDCQHCVYLFKVSFCSKLVKKRAVCIHGDNVLEDIKSKKKKVRRYFHLQTFLLSGLYLQWGQITWRCQILCNKWPSGPLMLGGQEMQNLGTWLQALFALGKMITELLVSLGQKTVCSFGVTANWIPFSSTLFLIIALYMHILYVKHFFFKFLQRVRNVSQPSFSPPVERNEVGSCLHVYGCRAQFWFS